MRLKDSNVDVVQPAASTKTTWHRKRARAVGQECAGEQDTGMDESTTDVPLLPPVSNGRLLTTKIFPVDRYFSCSKHKRDVSLLAGRDTTHCADTFVTGWPLVQCHKEYTTDKGASGNHLRTLLVSPSPLPVSSDSSQLQTHYVDGGLDMPVLPTTRSGSTSSNKYHTRGICESSCSAASNDVKELDTTGEEIKNLIPSASCKEQVSSVILCTKDVCSRFSPSLREKPILLTSRNKATNTHLQPIMNGKLPQTCVIPEENPVIKVIRRRNKSQGTGSEALVQNMEKHCTVHTPLAPITNSVLGANESREGVLNQVGERRTNLKMVSENVALFRPQSKMAPCSAIPSSTIIRSMASKPTSAKDLKKMQPQETSFSSLHMSVQPRHCFSMAVDGSEETTTDIISPSDSQCATFTTEAAGLRPQSSLSQQMKLPKCAYFRAIPNLSNRDSNVTASSQLQSEGCHSSRNQGKILNLCPSFMELSSIREQGYNVTSQHGRAGDQCLEFSDDTDLPSNLTQSSKEHRLLLSSSSSLPDHAEPQKYYRQLASESAKPSLKPMVKHSASPVTIVRRSANLLKPTRHSVKLMTPGNHSPRPVITSGYSLNPVTPNGHSVKPLMYANDSTKPETHAKHSVNNAIPANNSAKPVTPANNSTKPMAAVNNSRKLVTSANHSAKLVTLTNNSTKSVTAVNNSRKHVTPGNNSAKPVTPGNNSAKPVTPGNNSTKPVTPANNSRRPVTSVNSSRKPVTRADNSTNPMILANNSAKPVTPDNSSKSVTHKHSVRRTTHVNHSTKSVTLVNNSSKLETPVNNSARLVTPVNNSTKPVTLLNNSTGCVTHRHSTKPVTSANNSTKPVTHRHAAKPVTSSNNSTKHVKHRHSTTPVTLANNSTKSVTHTVKSTMPVTPVVYSTKPVTRRHSVEPMTHTTNSVKSSTPKHSIKSVTRRHSSIPVTSGRNLVKHENPSGSLMKPSTPARSTSHPVTSPRNAVKESESNEALIRTQPLNKNNSQLVNRSHERPLSSAPKTTVSATLLFCPPSVHARTGSSSQCSTSETVVKKLCRVTPSPTSGASLDNAVSLQQGHASVLNKLLDKSQSTLAPPRTSGGSLDNAVALGRVPVSSPYMTQLHPASFEFLPGLRKIAQTYKETPQYDSFGTKVCMAKKHTYQDALPMEGDEGFKQISPKCHAMERTIRDSMQSTGGAFEEPCPLDSLPLQPHKEKGPPLTNRHNGRGQVSRAPVLRTRSKKQYTQSKKRIRGRKKQHTQSDKRREKSDVMDQGFCSELLSDQNQIADKEFVFLPSEIQLSSQPRVKEETYEAGNFGLGSSVLKNKFLRKEMCDSFLQHKEKISSDGVHSKETLQVAASQLEPGTEGSGNERPKEHGTSLEAAASVNNKVHSNTSRAKLSARILICSSADKEIIGQNLSPLTPRHLRTHMKKPSLCEIRKIQVDNGKEPKLVSEDQRVVFKGEHELASIPDKSVSTKIEEGKETRGHPSSHSCTQEGKAGTMQEINKCQQGVVLSPRVIIVKINDTVIADATTRTSREIQRNKRKTNGNEPRQVKRKKKKVLPKESVENSELVKTFRREVVPAKDDTFSVVNSSSSHISVSSFVQNSLEENSGKVEDSGETFSRDKVGIFTLSQKLEYSPPLFTPHHNLNVSLREKLSTDGMADTLIKKLKLEYETKESIMPSNPLIMTPTPIPMAQEEGKAQHLPSWDIMTYLPRLSQVLKSLPKSTSTSKKPFKQSLAHDSLFQNSPSSKHNHQVEPIGEGVAGKNYGTSKSQVKDSAMAKEPGSPLNSDTADLEDFDLRKKYAPRLYVPSALGAKQNRNKGNGATGKLSKNDKKQMKDNKEHNEKQNKNLKKPTKKSAKKEAEEDTINPIFIPAKKKRRSEPKKLECQMIEDKENKKPSKRIKVCQSKARETQPASANLTQGHLDPVHTHTGPTLICSPLKPHLNFSKTQLDPTKIPGNPTQIRNLPKIHNNTTHTHTYYSEIQTNSSTKEIYLNPTQSYAKLTQTPIKATQALMISIQTPIKSTQAPTKSAQTHTKPTKTPIKPTHPSIKPTQTSIKPTQTPITPTQTSIKPTQTPIRPLMIPTKTTHSHTKPTQTCAIPTQIHTIPTQIYTIPTQTHTIPTQIYTIPKQTHIISTQTPTIPPQTQTVLTSTHTTLSKTQVKINKYKSLSFRLHRAHLLTAHN